MKSMVRLPDDLVERCKRFGAAIVANTQNGNNENSRSVTTHDAYNKPALQAAAKMAECAFCLYTGLNPLRDLHWGQHPDANYDAVFNGVRLDIKHTGARGHYLIWPLGKNHLFAKKSFDALVLVKGDPPVFEMMGWIEKRAFLEQRAIAPAGHFLTEGTWHLHEQRLSGLWKLCLMRDTHGLIFVPADLGAARKNGARPAWS